MSNYQCGSDGLSDAPSGSTSASKRRPKHVGLGQDNPALDCIWHAPRAPMQQTQPLPPRQLTVDDLAARPSLTGSTIRWDLQRLFVRRHCQADLRAARSSGDDRPDCCPNSYSPTRSTSDRVDDLGGVTTEALTEGGCFGGCRTTTVAWCHAPEPVARTQLAEEEA